VDPEQIWRPRNLDAVEFVKQLTWPSIATIPTPDIAEESLLGDGLRPTYLGGLGFGEKWKHGWMHDTLKYFRPILFRSIRQRADVQHLVCVHGNFVCPSRTMRLCTAKAPDRQDGGR